MLGATSRGGLRLSPSGGPRSRADWGVGVATLEPQPLQAERPQFWLLIRPPPPLSLQLDLDRGLQPGQKYFRFRRFHEAASGDRTLTQSRRAR